MVFTEFVASKRIPSGEEWAVLVSNLLESGQEVFSATSYFLYAEGFYIKLQSGGFYPDSWGYVSGRHETLASAEVDLFAWRCEFSGGEVG